MGQSRDRYDALHCGNILRSGILVPAARSESSVAAIVLITTALLAIPALVLLFMSFTGDEEILANGFVGSATILSLKPTAWRYNRQYPITRFQLKVEAGGASYPVEIKQALAAEVLQRLTPGTVVKVRVHREHHKRVVIDSAQTKPWAR